MKPSWSLASVTPFALMAALAIAGCSRSTADPSSGAPGGRSALAGPPPVAAEAQAKEIFATRCTPCHGAEGRGDGAASATLNPRPRNFHDAAWQASITDDYITKIVQHGGAAVSKSPAMPANPDLRDPAVLQAIAMHVRTLGATH